MKNKIIIWDRPIFVFKKIHKCPNCSNKIIPKVISEIINSKSKEAKNYDFSVGDSSLCGDVEFKYYVFFCEYCKKEYKINEIKNYERENKRNEIINKGGNKIFINIKLFFNKIF
jgi:DNA-directed RNA polymerase subunit RPC12/RpoP